LLTVPSGGGLNLNSGVYQINGTQLAASNLLNGVTGSGSIVLATSPTLTTPNIGAATGTSLAVTGNITSSGGQIGAGTASPVNSLDVNGAEAIGASYAGAVTAPSNGLLVQGNVGIGTTSPSSPLTVNGTIQSQSGGFKFPDGTVQTTSSGGTSGSVWLATVNASNASSVSFGSSYITNAYNQFEIVFDSVVTPFAALAGAQIGLEVSTDNGVHWIATNYSNSCPIGTTTATSYIPILSDNITLNSGPSNPVAQALQGKVVFSVPSSSAIATNFFTESDGWVNGYSGHAANQAMAQCYGSYAPNGGSGTAPTAINAVRFIDASGNGRGISGNFHLYGRVGL